MTRTPPYIERLIQQEIPISLPKIDILDELKKTYVKIPLLRAIKDILIYPKTIKELWINKSGRKKIYTPTIQVIVSLVSLMSTNTTIENMLIQGFLWLPFRSKNV